MSNTIIEVQHRFKKTKANKPMRAKFNLLVLQQMLPVWHENKEYQNGGWAPIRNESLMDFIPEEAKDEVEDTSMTGEELKKYILDTKLGVNEKQTKPNMIKDLKALWNV